MAKRTKTGPFRRATFWAREFRSPLFWFTHRRGGKFRDRTLVFRKGQMMHLYHLDDRVERAAKAGREFFVTRRGLKRYRAMADDVSRAMADTLATRAKSDLKKMSDRELTRFYSDTMDVMNSYLAVYVMTEEHCLSDIDETKYVSLLSELGEIRLRLRKEGEAMFSFLLGALAKEAARRAGLAVSDLFYYTHDEVVSLLGKGKKVPAASISTRKKGYALITRGGKQELLTGPRFRKLYREIVTAKVTEELRGRVAMTGSARGKVRLIRHDRRDISRRIAAFRPGEILVTEMTRPDTVLACRKAAAIVTDEGGLACHAAIISRELGIPCVVGTGNATQVLKDGDLVEVDAENGIVKVRR